MNIFMKIPIYLILLALSSVVSAKTYYVAPTGKDSNPGTLALPFATWQRGINSAYPGDTVFIRGGVYYITGNDNFPEVNPSAYPTGKGRSGTSDNPICFWAYPQDYAAGNFPILDCAGASSAYNTNYSGFGMNRVQYWHLKGLTVRKAYQKRTGGILAQGIGATECANLTFENCTVHDIGGRGFWYFSGAWNSWDGANPAFQYDTTRWINCDAYNLCDSLSANPGNAADGWKCHGYQNNYYSWEGCRAWNYSDDGFDPSGEAYKIFKNCWAMSTDKYEPFDIEGNGFKVSCLDVEFYHPELLADKVLAKYTNCIAAYCYGSGFLNNILADGVTGLNNNGALKNNTAYRNHINFHDQGVYGAGSLSSPTYINNIAVYADPLGSGGYEAAIYTPSIYNAKTNTWLPTLDNSWPGYITNSAFTANDADFVSVDASQLTWPRKVDGSLPDITFLKLIQGSDLIDAGTNVGLSFSGTAPDIGYAEYLSGTVTPATPVFVSAVIENAAPTRLEMTYNMTLANVIPASSAFAVRVNSLLRTVNSVTISGSKVMLILSSPAVNGDIITIAYTKPSANPLQTSAGGQANSITAQPVTNNVSPVSPVYVSSVVENATPARVEMTYNLTLANIVPVASAFTVLVNSTVRTVSTVSVSGTKVLLTLSSPVLYGDIVTVAYSKPSANPLQTSAGGQATSITAQPVTNNVNPFSPVYVSSVVENATPARVEMTYNLTLANIVPVASAFTVLVNSICENS